MATQVGTNVETQQLPLETSKAFFLTREELAEFHTRGFLGPYDLMPADEMKLLWKRLRLELFDRTKAVYPDAQPGTGIYD